MNNKIREVMENSEQAVGAMILAVEEVDYDDDNSAEWMAYEIAIHTDRGILRITGCHDLGPDLKWEEANV